MSCTNFEDVSKESLKLFANTLRTLSIDMVEKANSGHPGMPLGISDVLAVLFTKFVKFNVEEPKWLNRDRFILSAGHGSAVLYSLFHLLGYKDATLEELKNFRQLHSKAAGHPEYGFFKATEVTTGPLGQGIANGVGMAIAESILRAKFGSDVINHKTFVLAGDGCFMEGISFEAMALAGHLGLSNLIYIYDKNNITIDGKLSLADSTNFAQRFQASGFNVFECNGHDYTEIESALSLAVNSSNGKPSVVIAETKIGFSSPSKEGSEKSHGSPLGKDEIAAVKKALGLEGEPFFIKPEALEFGKKISKNALKHYEKWATIALKNKEFLEFEKADVEAEVLKVTTKIKQEFAVKREEKATRQHSAGILARICAEVPQIIGGSADLSESNGAKGKASKAITKGDFTGNYIHYGIREHAMGAIMNGILLHSNLKAYGSTFLVFADYMRPPIRLAALMKLPAVYILTHDSISLGEDGPTHQPVEHLTSLRIIPNLKVFRPADSIETLEALELAFSSKQTPFAIALSRQALKECTPFREENFSKKGAYFAYKDAKAKITLYASGSELTTAFEVMEILKEKKVHASIVSIPSLETFEEQTPEYKKEILITEKRVFIEAGIEGLLGKFIREQDLFFGVKTFGESGKASDLIKHFKLDAKSIAEKILTF